MKPSVTPRPGYESLSVYRNEGRSFTIDLTDNTNHFGSAPAALASLAAWARESPARYPTLVTEELRGAVAQWVGVAPDQILCGCGSNDLLDSTMRALGTAGARLAYAAPTFVMTAHFAGANSLVPVPVPTREDGSADIDALLATGAPIIYVASPNNPSGRATPFAELVRLVQRAPGLVIVDEAYVEFGGTSLATVATARDNVIVTRTFSKAWGLAGLRLGFGIGSARLLGEVEKARGPYKVNAVAERAATAAVREDREWLAGIVAETIARRTSVTARLEALGYPVFRSDANFIGVKVPDARRAADFLADRDIGVRAFPGAPVLGDLLRVTIGPESMMEPFLDAMQAVR